MLGENVGFVQWRNECIRQVCWAFGHVWGLLVNKPFGWLKGSDYCEAVLTIYLNFWTKSIGPFNIHTPYWRCFYNVFYTYDELYHEDFTSATWEFCYPCWTFTVKLHNCGCSYCVATGCSQDRKEAQQQQHYNLLYLYRCFLAKHYWSAEGILLLIKIKYITSSNE